MLQSWSAVQHVLVDISAVGNWVLKVDNKKHTGALYRSIHPHLLVNPLEILEVASKQFRFTRNFNAQYNQHNPVVVIKGSRERLHEVEQGLRLQRSTSLERLTSDQANTCIPLSREQVTTLCSLCKSKRYIDAWNILHAEQAFLDETAHLQRRGRKIMVDARLTMIRASWCTSQVTELLMRPSVSQQCFLVCVLYYPDCVKVMVPGGKRSPLLTSAENVARGGESTLEAAVREVKEETGLTIQEEDLISAPQQWNKSVVGMEFFILNV